ncbi:MAG: outer membrane lipoprotein-sorting protein [Candidatus Omnitrophica bacterium]|nr:outer membrane lipoprotein-sorting protein [Candidatus Omnitrophota bacterium]
MKKLTSMIAFLLAAGISYAYAQMSADQIAAKASHMAYYQGKDGRSYVKMVITDAQGRMRERQMTILRFNISDNGEQKYYVYFHRPSDVKGMSYIVWKHLGKDDDRWLYLPALDLVRRVAASDKRSSFAGTNFLYEDVSGRSVNLDNHELLSSDGDAYILKNTPKDADQVEFSYYKVWVDKKNFIPVKAEYYDKEGRLYRIVEATQVKDIQGYPTIVKMTARDLNSGSSTVADFTDVSYDIGINDSIFTERYLRNPPAQWIRG